MTSTTGKSAFRQGVLAGLPFILVAFPFATLFGVLAAEAGLSVAMAMGFSIVVIAGAAQFTALQLMLENAPVWIIMSASLAVNLRMAMYSAALVPHLGAAPFWQRALVGYVNFDQSYAVAIVKYEDAPEMSVADKVGYFLGAVVPVVPAWFLGTLFGAIVGSQIPDWLALDFAMPILFLSLVAPMMKTVAHLAAAGTSIVVALALGFMPSGTAVLIAGLVAMMVGAEVERRRDRA